MDSCLILFGVRVCAFDVGPTLVGRLCVIPLFGDWLGTQTEHQDNFAFHDREDVPVDLGDALHGDGGRGL